MVNITGRLKNTLIEALKASGGLLLEYFDKPIESNRKESQSSIVSEADLKSESLILEIIEQNFPSHNIISEESGFRDHQSEFTWIIDPLDGTSNFVSGIPWFGVLIALFRDNTPIMGGAYLPVQNLLYFAETEQGAFRNGEPLSPIYNKEIADSLIAFCVDYTEDKALLDREIETYKYLIRNTRNIRSTNSLVDFIYTAENRFGGVLNFNTKVWDIAAFAVILSEIGGIIKDINGSDIHFSRGKDLVDENFPVIAGGRQIVASLQKGISQLKHESKE
jgi:myo-inositol-1(or 4)-monophosphatase